MATAFVDTNVLVYAADESTPSGAKTRAARELLRLPDLYLSVQVLSEFTVNARNRNKLNLTPQQEQDWIQRFLLFPVVPLTVDTYLAAQLFHARYQVSHWDSLILAAAQESGCEMVYSEDLGHGQDYGEIKVINPFR